MNKTNIINYDILITHSKPWITKEDIDNVQNVLSSGMIARGELVRRFEKRVEEYNNCNGSVAFSSGTSALIFALIALGACDGKEVILPTYVCESVLKAVLFVRAKPVLCDIGEDTWNMTPDTVRPHMTEHTVAVIAVHIFGIPADIQGLKEFGVPIIEDCAQAFGTDCNGKKAGSVGDVGFYSFHATKCLTTGEGGMAVTRHKEIYDKFMRLKQEMFEFISPMSDLQAGLGLRQLERYDSFLSRRRKIAAFYFKSLPEEFTNKLKNFEKGNIFFRFPLYGDFDFQQISTEMDRFGIKVRKGVDSLLHRTLAMSDDKFSNAIESFKKTLSIPIYPSLENRFLEKICEKLNSLFY